jgi:integrase
LHLGYRRHDNQVGGPWIARFYVGDERYKEQKVGVADDYSEADGVEILTFWQAQARAREVWAQRNVAKKAGANRPYTVNDAVEDYLNKLEADGKSRHNAKIKLGLILPAFAKIPLADLTTDHINKWLTAYANTPRRSKTGEVQGNTPSDENAKRQRRASANRVLTPLNAALNLAFKNGKVESNAAWKRASWFKNTTQARTAYIDTKEAARLLNACEPDFRNLVRAALETGCRYSELTRLVVGDLNQDAGTLHIRKSKSGKPRYVILTQDGLKFFAQLCAGQGNNDHILKRADGLPWAHGYQSRPMDAAVKRAKLSGVTFHSLRHTWASLSVMSGMPLMVVARNLGHRDTKMVELHYGHLSPGFLNETIQKFAPRFGDIESNVKALR